LAFRRFAPCLSIFFCTAVLPALLTVAACTTSGIHGQKPEENALLEATACDGTRLKDAVTAFRAQDYATAHDLFERLSHEAQDRALRRQALFGLACVRLVQAQSPEEMKRALNTWSIWEEQSPPMVSCEDPRLLTPVLQRLVALMEKPVRVIGRTAKPPAAPAEWAKTVEEKDREIQELKERLRALEAIHRELEEKKRGLKE